MAGVPRRTVLGWLLGLPAMWAWWGRRRATGGVVPSLIGLEVPEGCYVPLPTVRPVSVPGVSTVTMHLTAVDGEAVAARLRTPEARDAIIRALGYRTGGA